VVSEWGQFAAVNLLKMHALLMIPSEGNHINDRPTTSLRQLVQLADFIAL
jgi:hypothetical protein